MPNHQMQKVSILVFFLLFSVRSIFRFIHGTLSMQFLWTTASFFFLVFPPISARCSSFLVFFLNWLSTNLLSLSKLCTLNCHLTRWLLNRKKKEEKSRRITKPQAQIKLAVIRGNNSAAISIGAWLRKFINSFTYTNTLLGSFSHVDVLLFKLFLVCCFNFQRPTKNAKWSAF